MDPEAAFGAAEEALAAALQPVAGRIAARVLAALADGAERTTAAVEKRAGLRQPEASVAFQRLKARGILVRRAVPPKGRGRPANAWRLAVPLAEAAGRLAAEAGVAPPRLP